MTPLQFSCPRCGRNLEFRPAGDWLCPAEGTAYGCCDGIWRFLRPERDAELAKFTREYQTVRRAEGRGSDDPAYYRALPFSDRAGRFAADWEIRARSFQMLVRHVLTPREERWRRPLVILDLGAGNGWLSYRLAQRQHSVAAVDLLDDQLDGLAAHVHYDSRFTPIQAEFDHLPLAGQQADLVIFNASFHYSTNYVATLREALRVLRLDGATVIMDSPLYHDASSGARMVQEREARFQELYGFAGNALPGENYLTYGRLDELATALGLRWRKTTPFYGWRWALRPWKARLLGAREPARFHLLIGERCPT